MTQILTRFDKKCKMSNQTFNIKDREAHDLNIATIDKGCVGVSL